MGVVATFSVRIKQKMDLTTLQNEEGADERYQNQEVNVKFSVSLVYSLMHDYHTNIHGLVWSKLWKMKVPTKFEIFIWIALQDRIMGNAERKRRGLTTEGNYDICPGALESADHIFRNCTRDAQVWMAMTSREKRRTERHIDFKSWIVVNIIEEEGEEKDKQDCRCVITLWWLWRWRNDRVFNGREVATQYKTTQSKDVEEEIDHAFFRQNSSRSTPRMSIIQRLQWNASVDHRFTLNVDASFKARLNIAGLVVLLETANASGLKVSCAKQNSMIPLLLR